MEITATVDTTNGTKIAVEKDLGTDLATASEKFGAEAVYNNFVDSAVITIQSAIRRLFKAGKPQAEIQAYVDGMTFVGGGTRGPRKDPMEAFLAKFETMDATKQREMLAQLKAKLAARG